MKNPIEISYLEHLAQESKMVTENIQDRKEQSKNSAEYVMSILKKHISCELLIGKDHTVVRVEGYIIDPTIYHYFPKETKLVWDLEEYERKLKGIKKSSV